MKWRYKFRQQWAVNQDQIKFILIRYAEDGSKSEVLTDDGWYGFLPYEILPSNLPFIDGAEMQNAEQVVNILADFEEHIRGLLNHAST